MSADQRSVHTDALATLGTIIGPHEQRDAIHLAVFPVQAGDVLQPGDHVGLFEGKAVFRADIAKVGIVDPFLNTAVTPGEWFWLVIYPRQINSLRHVWEHPAFPPSGETSAPITTAAPQPPERAADLPDVQRETSRRWLMAYAESLDLTYDDLMYGADEWVSEGDYLVGGENMEGVSTSPEFWEHYERVRDTEVDESDRRNFFSCSC